MDKCSGPSGLDPWLGFSPGFGSAASSMSLLPLFLVLNLPGQSAPPRVTLSLPSLLPQPEAEEHGTAECALRLGRAGERPAHRSNSQLITWLYLATSKEKY